MSDKSSIEWTDATWNPMRGCAKISPGCTNCYAATFAERFRGVKGHAYEQGFDPRFVPEKLVAPLKWKRPRRIFVNSMSDVFYDAFTFQMIAAVYGIMAASHARGLRHVFQVLTKRPDRALAFHTWLGTALHDKYVAQRRLHEAVKFFLGYDHPDLPGVNVSELPLPNVWMGVSVENRKHGIPRIEQLRKIPAQVRFLSVEPLLEDLGKIDLTGIDWVIVGGESGPKARPMHPNWVRNLRDQCVAARVPFFFKQWGHFSFYQSATWTDSMDPFPVGKKKAGRILDGREWNEVPL